MKHKIHDKKPKLKKQRGQTLTHPFYIPILILNDNVALQKLPVLLNQILA
jgi:hypothetical protein